MPAYTPRHATKPTGALATIWSRLADCEFWRAAVARAGWTAAVIALPYIAAAGALQDIPWWTVVSASILGAVAAILTALVSLPELTDDEHGRTAAALWRALRSFLQAIVAGIGSTLLIEDVPWTVVLSAALVAALLSLVRNAALATPPESREVAAA